MPLFLYRCPTTGYRVQGFVSEDTSEDHHIYEPMTCLVCDRVHYVNPATGVLLGERKGLRVRKTPDLMAAMRRASSLVSRWCAGAVRRSDMSEWGHKRKCATCA